MASPNDIAAFLRARGFAGAADDVENEFVGVVDFLRARGHTDAAAAVEQEVSVSFEGNDESEDESDESEQHGEDAGAISVNYACEATLTGHEGVVCSIAALPHNDRVRLVTGSGDGTLKLWDRMEGCVQTFSGPGDTFETRRVIWVTAFQDGRIVCGSGGGILKYMESDGRCLRTLTCYYEIQCVLALSDCHRILFAGTEDCKCWDVIDGNLLTLSGYHDGEKIRCVTELSEGRVVSGGGFTLRVWDLDVGNCLHVLTGHTGHVRDVTALQDGRIVSCAQDAMLKCWDLNGVSSFDERTLRGHTQTILCVVALFGGRVASGAGSMECTIKIWDLNSFRCLQTLAGHQSAIWSIAFLPGGRIASASYDQTCKIWSDPACEAEVRMAKEVGRQRACTDVVSIITKFI